MYVLMAIIFILGYLMIALEHPLKIDKAAIALLTGVSCWMILVFGQESIFSPHIEDSFIHEMVLHHVGEIAQILFFLLGAMTIVELIAAHDGFEIITSKIKTIDRIKLLWIICLITFFMSAVLDNLTTAIVMAALLKKLLGKKEEIWFFGGMVIIAANAGGAWSPIGDVTTIMLWIGRQITASSIVAHIFWPSLACLIVPLVVVTLTKKGTIERPISVQEESRHQPKPNHREQLWVLAIGIGGLLFVPIFKNLTHLPPFMGMLFSLGVLWVSTELMHRSKAHDVRHSLSIAGVIQRIDTPSILFFLGILLAVASLQTAGQLTALATTLNEAFSNIYLINIIIGLLSSIVDNVPLVAGAMGMYPLTTYPTDHLFWDLLAYCAGTGGSVLIIGSAAGVAIMGILKIEFISYIKQTSWLALIGYFAGLLVHLVMN